MATMVFQGYAVDDAGAAIAGATVHIFDADTSTPAREDAAVTSDANGKWTATRTLDNDGTDLYDVEISKDTWKRRRKYYDIVQLETIEVANLYLRNPADTYRYNLVPAAIAADRQLTLPLVTATETLAVLGAGGLAQAFANVQSIGFPATQVDSSNANTLDDYEEGTWTPVITFATPGNLSVVYGTQVGRYVKIGKWVTLSWVISTTTFTHTTASGVLRVTGVPFTSVTASGHYFVGPLMWNGITKANYTQVSPMIGSNAAIIVFEASGSGQAQDSVAVADVPTGGTIRNWGTLIYEAAT